MSALYSNYIEVDFVTSIDRVSTFSPMGQHLVDLPLDVPFLDQTNPLNPTVYPTVSDFLNLHPESAYVYVNYGGDGSLGGMSGCFTDGDHFFRSADDLLAFQNNTIWSLQAPLLQTVDLSPLTTLLTTLQNSVNALDVKVSNIPTKIDFALSQIGFVLGHTIDTQTKIDNLATDLSHVKSVTDSFNISGILTDLDNIKSHFSVIDSNISTVKQDVLDIDVGKMLTAINFSASMNGNNCEYHDNDKVTVHGRTGTYTVVSSFVCMVNDNQYTVMYRLVNNGAYTYVPEALLTLVTAP